MKKLLAIITAAAITAMAGTAMAADTTSTNLTVNASVAAACTATTNTNIDFGALNPLTDPTTTLASSKTSAGEIVVKCTQGTNYTLSAPATATIANWGQTPSPIPLLFPLSLRMMVLLPVNPHTIDASVDKTAYASAPAGAYTGTSDCYRNLLVPIDH